ncbi:hypothetical protein O1611_g8194 [Lasiodiplodia mahajangana]|uniref:Uncharacterized protein n=1 Tax=Lasiodiplodia mahajangana TaxID=1108764 RepID=A0ACC2JDK5_9PEZI|nr:hypothetical protein O1611_g8194 [Lasiodiplodia mahajangana]
MTGSLLTEQISTQKSSSGGSKPSKPSPAQPKLEAPKKSSYYETKPGNKTYGLGSAVDRYSGKSTEPSV